MARWIILLLACTLLLSAGCTNSQQKTSPVNNGGNAAPNNAGQNSNPNQNGINQNMGSVTPSGNDGGQNSADGSDTSIVPKEKDLNGGWRGNLIEYLHGVEGSYPEGCNVEQAVTFNFVQSGSALSGTTTSTVTKVNGCEPAIPASFIGMKTTGTLSGTVNGKSASFSSVDKANWGAVDFNLTFSDNALNGNIVTCHGSDSRCYCRSPDARCPGGYDSNGQPRSGLVDTINWWTGTFTATRMG